MGKKLLVVEDELDMLQMITLRLEDAGYDVLPAKDGQEALQAVKEQRPDLVILDVMIPKIDGYKVCGLLKADERFAKIPVLIFTARAQETDRQKSDEVGADAYINKPFQGTELLATIKDLLGEEE